MNKYGRIARAGERAVSPGSASGKHADVASNWYVRDGRDAALEDGSLDATYLVDPEGRRIREADVTPALALQALEQCEERHVVALALRVALRAIGSPAGKP